MPDLLRATLALYGGAVRATVQSLIRGWVIAVAVVGFAALMVAATALAAPLGMIGGFILGAVNALLIGATLHLVEQAVLGARRLTLGDIGSSFGAYFWEVIGVGFVLWIPMLVLDRGAAANPNGPVIVAAVYLLLFILLNPAPEVIYQVRVGSPLEVIKESYEFVLDNWVEWFLPLVVVVAPLGLSFFFGITGRLGRGAGLDFYQVLVLPFTVLRAWLGWLGLPESLTSGLLIVLTPLAAVAMLVFRGHLFAALHGSSHRQRLFRAGFGG